MGDRQGRRRYLIVTVVVRLIALESLMSRRRRHSSSSFVNLRTFVGGAALALLFLAAEYPGLAILLIFAAIALGIVYALVRRRRRPRRINARTLGELLALTPPQFEDAVADVLSARGYRNMRRVGGAGDLGAALVGRDPDSRSVIVQGTRYAPESRVESRSFNRSLRERPRSRH